jgi:hypothetical protein
LLWGVGAMVIPYNISQHKLQTKLNEENKMELDIEQKKVKPDYKGRLDVAGWVKKDKNGKPYISVKIASHVNLFKNEPREKKD